MDIHVPLRGLLASLFTQYPFNKCKVRFGQAGMYGFVEANLMVLFNAT